MKLLVRLFGAVALGVGTIFGWKTEPESHWSEAPNWIVSAEEASEHDDRGEPG